MQRLLTGRDSAGDSRLTRGMLCSVASVEEEKEEVAAPRPDCQRHSHAIGRQEVARADWP